jgi:hypothetical protein
MAVSTSAGFLFGLLFHPADEDDRFLRRAGHYNLEDRKKK